MINSDVICIISFCWLSMISKTIPRTKENISTNQFVGAIQLGIFSIVDKENNENIAEIKTPNDIEDMMVYIFFLRYNFFD